MKKETITQIILKADEGKVLTDGETFGTTVVLPETANQNEWYEITEEEYNSTQSIEPETI
jgi:hypothetical protein